MFTPSPSFKTYFLIAITQGASPSESTPPETLSLRLNSTLINAEKPRWLQTSPLGAGWITLRLGFSCSLLKQPGGLEISFPQITTKEEVIIDEPTISISTDNTCSLEMNVKEKNPNLPLTKPIEEMDEIQIPPVENK